MSWYAVTSVLTLLVDLLSCRSRQADNDCGYDRIKGEMQKLGYALDSDTVKTMLRQVGIVPVPKRSRRLNWRSFLNHDNQQLLACDFFTVETLFLQTLYDFFFIELGTRWVCVAGSTTHPTGAWVTQQARQFVWEPDRRRHRCALSFTTAIVSSIAFDADFASEPFKSIRTPVRTPNAYAERWVRSVREECLDKLVIINEPHLRQVMLEYIQYYNAARPHQRIDQQCPSPQSRSARAGAIRCRNVLGILNDYYRDVA
jgi:hypothetical protein